MTLMTIMTINAVIVPIPLMTKPHHGRSIILSFAKIMQTESLGAILLAIIAKVKLILCKDSKLLGVCTFIS